MTKFEAGKEYKTRDGNTARIYAVDCGGTYPIHGAVLALDGLTYHPVQWTVKGKICNDESQKRASVERIACVPLTYYKGEGLE